MLNLREYIEITEKILTTTTPAIIFALKNLLNTNTDIKDISKRAINPLYLSKNIELIDFLKPIFFETTYALIASPPIILGKKRLAYIPKK